jgi:hypothetical protein
VTATAPREPDHDTNGEPDETEFALELDEFLELKMEPPPPILGTSRNAILVVGGLHIIAGQEGIGKTTLTLDLAFSLASGVDWLGWKVPAPVSLLLIENEGPQHAFREKLREKREHWPHELHGRIYVQTWNWGGLSFGDVEANAKARAFLDEYTVDVVIGDPLDSLGAEGVGSPADVREFKKLLVPLGLQTTTAFVLLHHLQHNISTDEEVKQLSGVWGRPADLIMTVKSTGRPDQLRVNPAKPRWARDTFRPVVAGMIRETSGFERLGEEGDAKLLEDEIAKLLADGTWRTVTKIASKQEGGIGARRETVESCLRGNGHMFTWLTGREVGMSPRAVVWQLIENKDLRPETRDEDPTGAKAELAQARLDLSAAGEPTDTLSAAEGRMGTDTDNGPVGRPGPWDESGPVDSEGEPDFTAQDESFPWDER